MNRKIKMIGLGLSLFYTYMCVSLLILSFGQFSPQIPVASALRHSSIYAHPKVYWININKSQERRVYMENQFAVLGVENQRISAVEANSFDDLRGNLSILEIPCRRNTPKDLATVLSHIKAIKACLDDETSTDDFAIIMEDDVKLIYNIDFAKLIEAAPKPFGILQLASSNPETITKHFFTYNSHNHSSYFTPNKWDMTTKKQGYALYWSAQYYLVNKTLAREKLSFIYHYVDPTPRPKSKSKSGPSFPSYSSFPSRGGTTSFSSVQRSTNGRPVAYQNFRPPPKKNSNSSSNSLSSKHNISHVMRKSSKNSNNTTTASNAAVAAVPRNNITIRPFIRRSLSSHPTTQVEVADRSPQKVPGLVERMFKYFLTLFIGEEGEFNSNSNSNSESTFKSNSQSNSRSHAAKSDISMTSNFGDTSLQFNSISNSNSRSKGSKRVSGKAGHNPIDGADKSSLQNRFNMSNYNQTINWILKFKIINSFYPEFCKFTKAYPCVLSNCVFADTYIYQLLGPTYVSTIPLVIGGKIGYDSDLHQDHVYIHKLAFKIIHLMHDLMKNNSMISEVTTAEPISRHQVFDSESQQRIENHLPKEDNATTMIVDPDVGDFYSRLINTDNYRKLISSKGPALFPSYIVSTLQN